MAGRFMTWLKIIVVRNADCPSSIGIWRIACTELVEVS
jgi:hypothetical protein